jgi:hypothetical protein
VNLKKPKYAVTDDMYCTKKLCKNCLEPKNTYDIMDSYAVVALKEKYAENVFFSSEYAFRYLLFFYRKASFEITLQYEAVSAFTNLAMSSLRGDNKSSPN